MKQDDHHRLSRLWHRFIQQTHVSDSFFSCVKKGKSKYTATKDMSCINEKKKRREWERCSIPMPVFNQSFVFDMAQSKEPDRKRARFSKVNGDFWQKQELSRSQWRPKEVRAVIVFRDYLAGHQHGGLESGMLSEGLYVEALRQDGKPCQKSSILR